MRLISKQETEPKPGFDDNGMPIHSSLHPGHIVSLGGEPIPSSMWRIDEGTEEEDVVLMGKLLVGGLSSLEWGD